MKGEAPERGDCRPNLTINLDEHRLVSLSRAGAGAWSGAIPRFTAGH